jgi:methylmalonyl-CoA/ethylmalonyl-CoA epimerase
MLSEPEKPNEGDGILDGREAAAAASPSFVIYFRVENINDAHRELSSKGAKFIAEPHLIARMPDHELWMTFLSDGESNTLALMEERRN